MLRAQKEWEADACGRRGPTNGHSALSLAALPSGDGAGASVTKPLAPDAGTVSPVLDEADTATGDAETIAAPGATAADFTTGGASC